MTIKQREIITDFLKGILESGESGDFVNCYNDAKRFVNEIASTDSKLKEYVEIIEEDFENPF